MVRPLPHGGRETKEKRWGTSGHGCWSQDAGAGAWRTQREGRAGRVTFAQSLGAFLSPMSLRRQLRKKGVPEGEASGLTVNMSSLLLCWLHDLGCSVMLAELGTETRRGEDWGGGGGWGLTFSAPHVLLILSLALSGPPGRQRGVALGRQRTPASPP